MSESLQLPLLKAMIRLNAVLPHCMHFRTVQVLLALPRTVPQIQELTGLETKQIYHSIKSLRNLGYLYGTGKKHPHTWHYTPKGEDVKKALQIQPKTREAK